MNSEIRMHVNFLRWITCLFMDTHTGFPIAIIIIIWYILILPISFFIEAKFLPLLCQLKEIRVCSYYMYTTVNCHQLAWVFGETLTSGTQLNNPNSDDKYTPSSGPDSKALGPRHLPSLLTPLPSIVPSPFSAFPTERNMGWRNFRWSSINLLESK